MMSRDSVDGALDSVCAVYAPSGGPTPCRLGCRRVSAADGGMAIGSVAVSGAAGVAGFDRVSARDGVRPIFARRGLVRSSTPVARDAAVGCRLDLRRRHGYEIRTASERCDSSGISYRARQLSALGRITPSQAEALG